MLEIILIRHGLPEQIITEDGSPADPDLSAEGHDQADRMARWLESHHIDRLYSSPMKRAMQTAEPLARIKNLEIEVHEGVAEYDRHASHYIPVEKLKEVDPERWERLMRGEVDIDFPDFANTVIESLRGIAADNAGKRVAVACHGGVINVWTAWVLGFEPRLFFNPNYTSLNTYLVAEGNLRTILTINQFVHLDKLRF